VTLTANGATVTAGSGVVSSDGTYYFPWVERSAGTVRFVVTAGGVSRGFVAAF
jgi:hypothetical protein